MPSFNSNSERGKAEVVPYSASFLLAKDFLKPGECLCWETVIDSRFQLLPEISYYGQCLSSEVPGSFLTAYWKGRKEKLW